jgi:hypothetical protein
MLIPTYKKTIFGSILDTKKSEKTDFEFFTLQRIFSLFPHFLGLSYHISVIYKVFAINPTA